MTPNKAFRILALVLPLAACGDGSSDPKPDAAFTPDVAKPVDVPVRDGAMASGEVLAPLDGPVDRPADVARDGLVDTPTVDTAVDRPILDVGTAGPDGAVEVGAVGPDGGEVTEVGTQPLMVYPCAKDSDCCTVVDKCMARAFLYSKGVGASPAPSIPPNNGMCLACIQPAVQLRCQAGSCVGEKVDGYDTRLQAAHCGYIPLTDAGLHAPVDAAVQPTKTTWSCGS
jgi:hypothetical protein